MARLWVRNPGNYIREANAAGCLNIVFDGGYLHKRRMNVFRFMGLHLPHEPWEVIIIDNYGSRHHLPGVESPIGVYPTWDAHGDSMSMLEDWLANPVGEDEKLCADEKTPFECRPVFGQEHRVIIHNLPSASLPYGKEFLRKVNALQADYPKAKILVHGSYARKAMGTLDIAEWDIEPRTDASKGTIWLPNGRDLNKPQFKKSTPWIELLGFTPAQLAEPQQRCIFNIRAAQWLLEKPSDSYVMKTNDVRPDPTVPDAEYRPPTDGKHMMTRVKRTNLLGDKVDCNTCSLAAACKFYRKDSVCTLPGSEMSDLAQMFQSRDSATILDGLARVTALAARRTERAINDEEDFGLDPEVTKMLAQTFNFAERYAKLNDPFLRASVSFQHLVSRTGDTAVPGKVQVSELSAADAAAMAMEHYEKLGISRGDITKDMVVNYIKGLANPAIEGEVTDPVEVIDP